MRRILILTAAAAWAQSAPVAASDDEAGSEAAAETAEVADGDDEAAGEGASAAADTGDAPASDDAADEEAGDDTHPAMGYEVRAEDPARAEAKEARRWISPYLAIAGGLRFEKLALRPDQTRQNRHPSVAVSRFGVQGMVGDSIRFRSEFEANLGGPLGYGGSVWEGQAMMSVRDQYLQYDRAGWSIAAGRVTDTATVDFFSDHVADLLATDVYVRDPLLYSGYDRGTGLFAKYELAPGLRAGLTFHSTNPTGITGTMLTGGELFPYDRPFYLAAAQVGRNEFMQPDQNLHIYFATPSIEYEDDFFEFRSAAQGYVLDTQMSTNEDERIRGYNLRASARLKLLDGQLAPFLNASRNENELLDPQDATIKLADTYEAYTVSGGADLHYSDRAGVGAQVAYLRQRHGDGRTRQEIYLNLGHTLWIEDGVSLGLRYAAFMRGESNQVSEASMLGFSGTFGHQSLFLTSRLLY